MALMQVDFFSFSLMRITNFNIILPNDVDLHPSNIGNPHYQRKIKTLYLLHGYTGTSKDWLLNSPVVDLAQKYNFAVVMPSGDNSFYLDAKGSGRAYCQFVGNELIDYTRKTFGLSDKKEDTFIGGFSMGGFGAIHTGLMFPDTFGKIMALSSALIIHNIENLKEGERYEVADYDYFRTTFGDLDQLEQSPNNPEYLVRQLKANGQAIPPIYMACGTEDLLVVQNRAFHEFLLDQLVDVKYSEGAGIHDWTFWNKHLESSIQWMLG